MQQSNKEGKEKMGVRVERKMDNIVSIL